MAPALQSARGMGARELVKSVKRGGRFEVKSTSLSGLTPTTARAHVEVARLAHRHPTWRVAICVSALVVGIAVMALAPAVAWPIASALGVLEVAFGWVELVSRLRGRSG